MHEPMRDGFYSNHDSSVPRCQLSPLVHPAPNKCELNCIPKGQNFYYKHKDAVVDGTPCEPGQRDICVDGVCRVSYTSSQLAGGLLWVVTSSISRTKWMSGAWWLLKSLIPQMQHSHHRCSLTTSTLPLRTLTLLKKLSVLSAWAHHSLRKGGDQPSGIVGMPLLFYPTSLSP